MADESSKVCQAIDQIIQRERDLFVFLHYPEAYVDSNSPTSNDPCEKRYQVLEKRVDPECMDGKARFTTTESGLMEYRQ